MQGWGSVVLGCGSVVLGCVCVCVCVFLQSIVAEVLLRVGAVCPVCVLCVMNTTSDDVF